MNRKYILVCAFKKRTSACFDLISNKQKKQNQIL
jgi:hypothetical protein